MSRSHRFIIIALIVLGTVLYAFNMNNMLFWDDADWIVANPCIHDPMSSLGCLLGHDVLFGIGQSSNYFRPFLMLTFALNWALGGDAPFGYHLISNGLHIANAVLIFLLLSRLLAPLQVVRQGRTELVSGVAALFWLVHPLQTEAVAYISGRGDPLSVFLMLSSLLLWLRTDRWRWVALVCAVLAIFSRETAVLFPLYLTVGLVAFEYKDPFWRALKRAIFASWPFYSISAVYGLQRLTVLNFDNTLNWYAQSNAYTENILYRIWTFLQVLWVYIRLAFVPLGLHMERNVPVLTAPWQYPAFLGIVVLLLATLWVVRSWRQGNRIPFFGALMFLIPLAPSSGILAPINALIYEHWLYLSMFGFATLVAVYGVQMYDRVRQYSRPFSVAILIVAVCYAMFLGVQTIRRNIIWGNPERLYLQVLQYQPQNVRVLNNLANLYADEGNVADAEQLWLRAVESDPMQPAPYHNLANLERDRGNTERAIELYRKATGVDPRFTYSYQNLAALLLELDRVDEAAPVLAQWQKADPRHPLTYHLLARIFAANGDIEDARAILERGYPAARAAGPDFVAAYDELMSKLK